MNDEQTRELIFYELTWSPITTPQKEALAADSANTEGLPRSNLNGSLKSFMNATVPDMLIYNGNGYEKITKAIEDPSAGCLPMIGTLCRKVVRIAVPHGKVRHSPAFYKMIISL